MLISEAQIENAINQGFFPIKKSVMAKTFASKLSFNIKVFHSTQATIKQLDNPPAGFRQICVKLIAAELSVFFPSTIRVQINIKTNAKQMQV